MAEAGTGDAKRRTAVVLFNLGGPDDQDSVRSFLFNLFADPAIIGAPGPVRLGLAWLISTLREKEAKANYALMGGGSPLLPETERQAAALGEALSARAPDREWGVFIAMRYWAPFVPDAARQVQEWGADEVVLLPLYPQYSTTTTGSSLEAWRKAWSGPEGKAVCCYPEAPGLAEAHADLIRKAWMEAGSPANARLLFSAHGLPESVIARGDPYQNQVERTAAAISALLPELPDTEICYQSRVGPMKWIGPPTDETIAKAAGEGKAIIVCPIAFVSEHVETLVELDVEYRALAQDKGAAAYIRAPAPGVHPAFIAELADLGLAALGRATEECPTQPAASGAPCGITATACPFRLCEAENAAA